jgi:hypothetical protein
VVVLCITLHNANIGCQPGTLVHTVHCELYLQVTLGHMIPLLVEYINAVHSCLNTTTFFSLSHPPFARSSHIRQTTVAVPTIGVDKTFLTEDRHDGEPQDN